MNWVCRAATLTERLDRLGTVETPASSGAELRASWQDSAAGGDEVRFARRLAELGLAPADVGRLALVACGAPSWEATARAAQHAARTVARDRALDDERVWKGDAMLAYASLWEPWVRVASAELRRRPGCDDDRLVAELEELLRRRLAGIGERTAHEHFLTTNPGPGTAPYRAWLVDQLSGGMEELFEEYPVLARLLAIASEQWVDASEELCVRLGRDRSLLEQTFEIAESAPITTVQALGDAHDAGRQVLRLLTSTGASVIYKPRSIEAEQVFAEAVRSLRTYGGIDVDVTPQMVAGDGYGWCEFIEARPCATRSDLIAHSRRAGAALAVAHLLAVTDLHLENVIIAGDRPVFVDLECMATVPLRTRQVTGLPQPLAAVHSVLSTCLLPGDSRGRPLAVDIAGLTATKEQVSGDLVDVWTDLGTGTIRRSRQPMELWSTVPRPSAAGQPPVDVDALLDGLGHALDVVARHGIGVRFEQPSRRRVVVRDTQSYAEILQRALAPEHLRDGLRFSIALDAVVRTALDDDAIAWHLAMAERERRSLELLDIPLATGTWASTDLEVAGDTIPGVLVTTGAALLAQIHAGLDGPAVRLQQTIAQIALEAHLGPGPVRTSGRPAPGAHGEQPLGDAAVLDTCIVLAEQLEATAVDMGDGSVQWCNAIMQHDERVAGGLGGGGLYTGSSGVAIALAALAHTSGDARWADLARRAVRARTDEDDRSLADGIAGHAYATATVGALLEDDALVSRAVDVLLAEGARGGGDLDVDLMGGFGGLVLAMASVARTARSASLAAAAVRAAHELRERWIAQRGRDLVSANKANRLGLAHGTGGTTLAVARTLALKDDARLSAWLDELLRAENERIERRGGEPCRVSADEIRKPDVTWCWGTAGFAVARRAIDAIVPGAPVRAHLARADEINATARPVLHRLCCGSAGTMAALEPGSFDHERHRRSLVEAVGAYALEDGTRVQHASLFRGTAGVLAVLVRSIAPAVPDLPALAPTER